MIDKESEIFVQGVKNQFQKSIDSLDGATLSRITRIRHQALERATKPRNDFILWLPAGAVASVCMAFLVYSLVPQKTVEDQSFIDEIDIISDLDLYENLDFYEWLEQHELPS